MENIFPIPNVMGLVVQCWSRAEAEARVKLETLHYDEDEEFITKLFLGEFRGTLAAATARGDVRKAFLADLKSHQASLPFARFFEALAAGISATVTFHPREMEKRTGGDLGLVLSRPNLAFHRLRNPPLSIDEHHRRGLLCQAKIKRRSSGRRRPGWGALTLNQRKALTERTGYLSLLLYEYRDAQRMSLLPFRWQVCAGKSLDDVEGWLRSDTFPELLISEQIIRLLGDERIGTSAKEVIDEIITPSVRSSLIIRIGWRPGQGPSQNLLLQKMLICQEPPSHVKHVA